MPNPADAFTPAKVIDSPDRFSGRQGQLQAIADALDIDGGHIVIYGNRGVGKSSLAQQMMLMSQDHADVTARLSHQPFTKMDFLPIYLQCDDSLRTIDDVLLRLLTSDTALRDWIPYRVVARETEGQVQGGATVKILSLTAGSKSKVVENAEAVTADLRTTFLNAVQAVIDSGVVSRGILLVIDEFDRVADRTSLASLLKSVGEKVKFALVGVATNVSELVNEHESVSRQLTGGCISVPPMNDEEIEDIFNRGEGILDNAVAFDRGARDYISQVSRGHPFLVHLICLTSAIVALRSNT